MPSSKGSKPLKRKRSKDARQDDNENVYGLCPNVSSRYEKLGRIGEGTYGVVYKARDKETSQLVALKRCLPHYESSDGFPLTTLREIQTLRMCRGHPNIIHLQEVAVSSSRSGVFLVFDYCQHDLANLIDSHFQTYGKSPFREPEVKRLLYQLLSALEFIHDRHILHRDLKMSNLLYNDRVGHLRLADFGLSRKFSHTLTPKVVSLWYRPPELLFGGLEYTEAIDLWGAGCVLAELLEGVPLMNGQTELEQIAKIFDLLGPPTLAQWPQLCKMPLIQNGTVELPREGSPSSFSRGTSLLDRFSHLSGAGLSLLSKLLSYDYTKRGTSTENMQSMYFSESPKPVHPTLMPKFPSKHGKLG